MTNQNIRILPESNGNSHLMNTIRSVVRPTLTISVAGVLLWGVVRGIAFPEWYVPFATGLIIWWFADRPKSQ